MPQQPNLQEAFVRLMTEERDAYIKPWLVSWAYQDKKQVRYQEELPQDFYQYEGVEDFAKWFNWQFDTPKPDFFDPARIQPLLQQSLEFDQALFQRLGLPFPEVETYKHSIARNNAQDFCFTHMYELPERCQVKKVLDFGAGYGRQFNLWSQHPDTDIFVGMDAIPKSYCLQQLYYEQTNRPVVEYVDDPKGFQIHPTQKATYHLPTWRSDLLPDNFFDMILCVHVLPELNGKLVKHMLEVFHRILKPGGALYLRDNEEKWKPGFKFNLRNYLEKHGFSLEFRPYLIKGEDLADFSRIWRKNDPQVAVGRLQTKEEKLRQLAFELDAASQGRLRRLYKKIVRKV
jgi:SAM-dependent methyltransferase